jgi:hypothetical protein
VSKVAIALALPPNQKGYFLDGGIKTSPEGCFIVRPILLDLGKKSSSSWAESFDMSCADVQLSDKRRKTVHDDIYKTADQSFESFGNSCNCANGDRECSVFCLLAN